MNKKVVAKYILNGYYRKLERVFMVCDNCPHSCKKRKKKNKKVGIICLFIVLVLVLIYLFVK